MKKILLTLLLLACFAPVSAQRRQKQELVGKYEVNDDNRVVFLKTFEFPGKERNELFDRLVGYFSQERQDIRLEASDRESGHIQVKITFPQTYYRLYAFGDSPRTLYSFDSELTMNVSVRDGRVYLPATFEKYNIALSAEGFSRDLNTWDLNPAECYPVVRRPRQRWRFVAFYNTYHPLFYRVYNDIEEYLQQTP